jgi:hypothetical protein
MGIVDSGHGCMSTWPHDYIDRVQSRGKLLSYLCPEVSTGLNGITWVFGTHGIPQDISCTGSNRQKTERSIHWLKSRRENGGSED